MCVSVITLTYYSQLSLFLGFSLYLTVCHLELRAMCLIYYSSLHQRKPSGVHLHRAQFHHEEEDGAFEGGNGTDRTLTAGQKSHSLFMHFAQSIESLTLPKPARSCFCSIVYICSLNRLLNIQCHNRTWCLSHTVYEPYNWLIPLWKVYAVEHIAHKRTFFSTSTCCLATTPRHHVPVASQVESCLLETPNFLSQFW